MAVSPFFFDKPLMGLATITTDTPSLAEATVIQGQAYGNKVVSCFCVTDSTVNLTGTIGVARSGVFYPMGTKTIGASAGLSNSNVSVNLLDPGSILGLPYDNDGNPFLYLQSSDDSLCVRLTTGVALPATRTVWISAVAPGDAS